jgi:hypothetical protein
VARRGIGSLSRAGPVQAFRPRDPGNRLVCGFGLNGTNNGIPVAVHLSFNLELHGQECLAHSAPSHPY